MYSKDEILLELKKMKNEIKDKYKINIKGLFGSYIKDRQTEESDIDILIDMDEEVDLFDISGLSIFLEEQLCRKIDLVPESCIREELRDCILMETVYI